VRQQPPTHNLKGPKVCVFDERPNPRFDLSITDPVVLPDTCRILIWVFHMCLKSDQSLFVLNLTNQEVDNLNIFSSLDLPPDQQIATDIASWPICRICITWFRKGNYR